MSGQYIKGLQTTLYHRNSYFLYFPCWASCPSSIAHWFDLKLDLYHCVLWQWIDSRPDPITLNKNVWRWASQQTEIEGSGSISCLLRWRRFGGLGKTQNLGWTLTSVDKMADFKVVLIKTLKNNPTSKEVLWKISHWTNHLKSSRFPFEELRERLGTTKMTQTYYTWWHRWIKMAYKSAIRWISSQWTEKG